MRTIADDGTADQLLDYLASDGQGRSGLAMPTWPIGNRSTTSWVNEASSADWPKTSPGAAWPTFDGPRKGCN
jgi:hypothetical protein